VTRKVVNDNLVK